MTLPLETEWQLVNTYERCFTMREALERNSTSLEAACLMGAVVAVFMDAENGHITFPDNLAADQTEDWLLGHGVRKGCDVIKAGILEGIQNNG